MERDYRAAARVSKALCDPKRLAILGELRDGEKRACVLQELVELTQPGLSYHMRMLCESNLVESRQEGKWTHYQLSRTGRDHAVKLLLELTTPVTEQGIPLEQRERNMSSQQMTCFRAKHQNISIYNM